MNDVALCVSFLWSVVGIHLTTTTSDVICKKWNFDSQQNCFCAIFINKHRIIHSFVGWNFVAQHQMILSSSLKALIILPSSFFLLILDISSSSSVFLQQNLVLNYHPCLHLNRWSWIYFVDMRSSLTYCLLIKTI